jgi:hypothetical protein
MEAKEINIISTKILLTKNKKTMKRRAIEEIEIAKPYFDILASQINPKLRKSLIQNAPPQFFNVVTQIIRHLLNNSFCNDNRSFCAQYENSLYLIALPETSLADKQKILQSEPSEFISRLSYLLHTELDKNGL